MAKDDTYKQCDLSQGDKRITAWIPTRGAILGASVEMTGEALKGQFYTVDHVYNRTELTAAQLHHQQTVTRNSLPSIR
jgi:hypothetical protein